MPNQSLAVASAKSFGDFVIAHSILNRVADGAKHRIRLISCSHVEPLQAVLPGEVDVTLVNSGNQVPALFDMRKRGLVAATQSALTLRREFRRIRRKPDEVLTFEPLGVRERFIAGEWHLTKPARRESNVYDTYLELLREHGIQTLPAPPDPSTKARSIGIFPESRLPQKRLNASALALIFERAALAGMRTRLFLLEGDTPPVPARSETAIIPRSFASLIEALGSVDKIISADSLPAHLGEYLLRPVFVATPAPNEYWLPHRCFQGKRWGNFNHRTEFSAALDRFLVPPVTPKTR